VDDVHGVVNIQIMLLLIKRAPGNVKKKRCLKSKESALDLYNMVFIREKEIITIYCDKES
jgi:hypothetical protein